jgi:hypothetical protein
LGADTFGGTASTMFYGGCYGSHTYGALPSSFPSSGFTWVASSDIMRMGIKI